MNLAHIQKWMMQIHGIRFLLKTFVGRIQYAPTWGHEWFMQICMSVFRCSFFVMRFRMNVFRRVFSHERF